MYIYIYIYAYIYMHIYMDIYVYIYAYIYITPIAPAKEVFRFKRVWFFHSCWVHGMGPDHFMFSFLLVVFSLGSSDVR